MPLLYAEVNGRFLSRVRIVQTQISTDCTMPTLSWIGKEKVLTHHVPHHVLDHKYGFRSSDPGDTSPTGDGNMIIHGDNLEALKALLPRYEGAVKCIYIDPPYNTGKEGWVYDDNVNDPRLKKWLGEVVGPEGEDLSRDDKWLCMMFPRLVLLRQLLREDGVIFISIDDNEQANLKLICDEIFGAGNFVGQWMWFKSATPPNLSYKIKKNLEYVLCYEKHKSKTKYRGIQKVSPSDDPIIKPQNSLKDLTFPPKSIHFKGSDGIMKAGEYGTKQYPNILLNDATIIDGTNENEVSFRNRFIWMQDKLDAELEGGTVINCSKIGVLSYKKTQYDPEVPPNLIDQSVGVNTTEEAGKSLSEIFGKHVFDYPKEVSLIEYLINFQCDKDSLILDSFAGSGTTAHAVLELNKKDGGNRKFILIEKMDYAESITAERVKRVMTGYPYMGKKEEDIYSVELTAKNLSRGAELLQEAQFAAETAQGEYDKISKPLVKDGRLKVVGTTVYEENMPGLGGAFDYYELGEPLFKQDNLLNEAVGEDKIREYIYYSETRSPLTRSRKGKEYFLDKFNGVGYYFYYNPQALTSLNLNTLNIITEKAESYVIYADVCNLPESFLSEHNIVFKQIPRDIKRF